MDESGSDSTLKPSYYEATELSTMLAAVRTNTGKTEEKTNYKNVSSSATTKQSYKAESDI